MIGESDDQYAVMRERLLNLDSKDLDKCKDFWDGFNLLDGIEDNETARRVAREYTKMTKYLFTKEGVYPPELEVCAFPVIRRIFTQCEKIPKGYTPKKLYGILSGLIKESYGELEGASVDEINDFLVKICIRACEPFIQMS